MTDPLDIPAEQISVVEVTPETAQYWLDKYNNHNRGMRNAAVNRYARDMMNGKWLFNGEPIQFDTEPKLQNGQHRLASVVRSGRAQKFIVITGLPPEAQDSMDAGVRRTPGDVLALSGYGSNGKTLATVARLALQMEQAVGKDMVRLTRGFTTAEIKTRIERDPALVKAVEAALTELQVPAALATKTVVAYCYYRFSQINAEQALVFFRDLVTLANLPGDSPIIALHRRLTSHTASSRKTPDHSLEAIAYVITAWNAWRRNEQREHIRLGKTHGDQRLRIPIAL